jgi:hypothetical protein
MTGECKECGQFESLDANELCIICANKHKFITPKSERGMLETINSFSSSSFGGSCNHPELKISNVIITGGKNKEQMNKADILIFFDTLFMPKNIILSNDPNLSSGIDQTIVYFPIVDQYTPDKELLNGLLKYLNYEITYQGNKRIHMQCMGGHGRTGLVLACLIHKILDEQNPVKWVKENYCIKAVESNRQYQFIADFTGTPLYERKDVIKNNNHKKEILGKNGELLTYFNKPIIDRDEVCGRCDYGITRHGNGCQQFRSINCCHKK